jgi:hypothetical protein
MSFWHALPSMGTWDGLMCESFQVMRGLGLCWGPGFCWDLGFCWGSGLRVMVVVVVAYQP